MESVVGILVPVGLYGLLMALFVTFLAKALMAEERSLKAWEASRATHQEDERRHTPNKEAA